MKRQIIRWTLGLLALMSLNLGATELADFTHVAQASEPAVVNITATSKSMVQGMDPQAIFRQFFGGGLPQQAPVPQISQSLGSGFIISSDGYILTNNHVVHGASKVIVKLSDRREYQAKVIGTDQRADIALLKIAAKDLPVVQIGNPDQLQVGQWVLAIGSPFGFDYTVTHGIISATSRALPNEAYVPFIQTDVPINPGNSGGPLINMQGQVVGINSQIYSRSGGFMGLSFAIPIDVAMEAAKQLKQHGKVRRGYLGVEIQEVTRDLATVYGLPKPAGALVAHVMPDSPAAHAGLKEGDVIIALNGHSIDHASELPQWVGRLPVDSTQSLSVVRAGKTIKLPVKIGLLPALGDDVGSGGGNDATQGQHLGLQLRDLSPEEKQAIGVAGVVVTQVVDGPAADAGVHIGDVIVRIDHHDIADVQAYTQAVQALPRNKPVELVINRQGNNLILAITLTP